jgi:ACS family hexuronate transporter-like MFS transporter
MKIKGLRWWIIGLIAVATIINYIDRSAINIMWPYIYKEFGIADVDSKQALALITTCFMITYALGQMVTGRMMDAIGTRWGMVASISAWSLSIALHAFSRTIASFNVFRAMLGFSEAGNWPGATKSNAEWFPSKERAIAQGIFGAGASLGSVVAAPFIAYVYLAFGWRATFVGIGVLGIIWILPWLLINKNVPSKHPWITEKELKHIESDLGQQSASQEKLLGWKELLKIRNSWGIISSRFFLDPVWWMFLTWLPTFLKEQMGFDIKQVGAFAWLPYLFAAIGGLSGGFYSSYRVRSGVAAPKARKEAISIGCSIMLAALFGILFSLDSLKDQVELALFLIGMTLFGFQFLINNLQTLPSDYFNGKNVGTVSGMGGTAAVLGTIGITLLVPIISKTSYHSFFVTAAMLVPLGWCCIYFLTSENRVSNKEINSL